MIKKFVYLSENKDITLPMRIIILIISIINLTVFTSCNEYFNKNIPEIQNLDKNWRFKKGNDDCWYKAEVPGYVHTDLLNNNLIPDPYIGDHEKKAKWVYQKDWVYRTHFKAKPALLDKENIRLIFKGLDTYAEVYLNDSLLFQSNNMFIPWNKEVKKLLKKENKLTVHLHSPLSDTVNSNMPAFVEKLPGYERIFTRKAAFHYGWDWAPRLIPSGIYRSVLLEAWDIARIENYHLQIKEIDKKQAQVQLNLSINSNEKTKAKFEFSINSQNYSHKLRLKKGIHKYSISFSIADPTLWWVHNLGDPHLYNLKGALVIKSKVTDSLKAKLGLRKIQLAQQKDKAGKTFYFKLNGKRVFMKGSNYVPQDVFLSRVDTCDYKKLIQQVLDANMNMIRVWGGGIYEKELFYDLCDKFGILVWQDFMFANAMYHADDKFIQNIQKEAEYQVQRLRSHPCIALWCGNNEIDEAWHNWGWSNPFNAEDSTRIWKDYQKIFHELLPEIVQQYHPGADYVSSSPAFGRGDIRSLYQGDSHYWSVWHDGYDFTVFDSVTGRFMSEYGFQGFPPVQSIRKFINKKKISLKSDGLTNHQKHSRGMAIIRNYMKNYYPVPEEPENFVYISQLLQAEGIANGIEAHRRHKPYCMGTLYWQLNDCWPAISWSSVDYYDKWKALHYKAGEALKNIIISTKKEADSVKIWLINDDFKDYKGKLQLRLLDFEGEEIWQKTINIKLEKDTSKQVYARSRKKILQDHIPATVFLETTLQINGDKSDHDLSYFTAPKHLKLIDPEIDYSLEKKENHFEIELTSNNLAKNVHLSVPYAGNFSKNYFDLLPGEKVKVTFPSERPIEEFRKKLSIVSLFSFIIKP